MNEAFSLIHFRKGMVGNMDIKKNILDIIPEVIRIRREFHAHPELSGKEVETNKRICRYLDEYGIEYKSGYAGYGVVGIIRGGEKGKTVGIRADIDALPIYEDNNLEYKSVNEGIMHACGHDAHTAILLGTAMILKGMERHLKGNVKLFFQPQEEAIGGAEQMIKEGCLDNPKTDHVIGLHVMPNVPTGKVELRYGKLNGNTGNVKITVKGKSGHAAYPDTAVDAIVIAAHIITALQTMVSRNISPLKSVVLTIGKINGGEKSNIIAKEVVLSGTLRALDTQTRNKAKEFIKKISENVAIGLGGNAEVDFKDGYIELINDDNVMKIVEETANEVVGRENIVYKEFPSLGGEDFSYFTDRVPSAFFHLGCGNEELKINAPLHSDKFALDEDCLKTGIEMEVRTVLKLLSRDL